MNVPEDRSSELMPRIGETIDTPEGPGVVREVLRDHLWGFSIALVDVPGRPEWVAVTEHEPQSEPAPDPEPEPEADDFDLEAAAARWVHHNHANHPAHCRSIVMEVREHGIKPDRWHEAVKRAREAHALMEFIENGDGDGQAQG